MARCFGARKNGLWGGKEDFDRTPRNPHPKKKKHTHTLTERVHTHVCNHMGVHVPLIGMKAEVVGELLL